MRKIRREAARKIQKSFEPRIPTAPRLRRDRFPGCHGSVSGWRLTQTPYNWMPDWAHRVTPYLFSIRVIRVIRGELFLLFFTEFLESRIAAQRVPHRVEPKKGSCNRRWP